MTTKEYYLTLLHKDKLTALRQALKSDVQSFMIISQYYLDTPIDDGGLPRRTIDREFRVGLKQKYYISKLNKTND
tara:strand:- start:904 stop:1128 length:225 start_codon:yes stop_codon:yes gene_type:complete